MSNHLGATLVVHTLQGWELRHVRRAIDARGCTSIAVLLDRMPSSSDEDQLAVKTYVNTTKTLNGKVLFVEFNESGFVGNTHTFS